MERESKGIRRLVRVAVFGSVVGAFALTGGNRNQETAKNDPDGLNGPAKVQSGEQQIDLAREVYDQVLFQNETRRESRQEAKQDIDRLVKSIPTPTPVPPVELHAASVGTDSGLTIQAESLANFDCVAALEKAKVELPGVLEIAKEHPESFPDLVALQMYYPIYRVVGLRFGVPWTFPYVMHEQESRFSTDPRAFLLISDQIGSMQRNIEYHPDEAVKEYFKGMGCLLVQPVRHPDYPNDTEEINYAVAALKAYFDQTGSWGGALGRYGGGAEYRLQITEEIASLDLPK